VTVISPGSLPIPDLPPILRADLTGPPIERKSWVWTIGPAYAGVFIWVPFFDRMGTFLRGEASPGWLAATGVLASMACYLFLYLIPAFSGWTAKQRVSLVGASTFGTLGSEWITGVAVALAAIGFYAVSLYMALRLTLLGLISCRLVDLSALEPMSLGPVKVEGPVFLLTALFWIFITGTANRLRLTGVIVALMQVYTPVALLLLGATALLTSSGLPSFPAAGAAVSAMARQLGPNRPGGISLFELVFGYFAVSGLMAVDWGMAVRHRRDVRIGGWMAIILAGSFCAVMSLLTVAGAVGRTGSGMLEHSGSRFADPLTFHGAVFHGIGGYTGGAILLLFGLATLAPACYAVYAFSTRLSAHWPGISPTRWTWLGAGVAFILIATSGASRLEATFSLMGAVFAPAVGAISADWIRRRGEWRGVRMGVNPAGLIAWGVGALIGVVASLGAALGWRAVVNLQPAALFAFLAAVGVYAALASLGFEPPRAFLPGDDGRAPAEAVPTASGNEAVSVQSLGGSDGAAHGAEDALHPGRDSGTHEAGSGPGAI
jgi:cytosine permease